MSADFDPTYFSTLAESMRNRSSRNHIPTDAFHTILGANEIKQLIKEFNPSTNPDLFAHEWIKQIEQLGKLYNWDSYHLLLYATMRLSGIAKIWFEYALENIKNWEDFKFELIKNFPRSADPLDIHAKLLARKRQYNEPAVQYVHTMISLARKLYLDDGTVVEYLIKGLNNLKQEMILSAMNIRTPSEFLQHIELMESSTDEFKQPENKLKRPLSNDKSPNADKVHSPPKKKQRTCFNCKGDDHFMANCPNVNTASNSKDTSFNSNEVSSSKPYYLLNVSNYKRESEKKNQDQEENQGMNEKNQKPTKKPKVCFKCKEEGHLISQCPNPSQIQFTKDLLEKIDKEQLANYDLYENIEDAFELTDLDLSKHDNLLVILQKTDIKIVQDRQILELKLEKSIKQKMPPMKVINGTVYHNTFRNKKQGLRYSLPHPYAHRFIKYYHINGGHADEKTVTREMEALYRMPKMLRNLRMYLDSCATCAIEKMRASGDHHMICTKESSSTPFYMLNLSFLGPLARSKNAKEYVFIVEDIFSGFVKLQAVEAQNVDIVKKFISWIGENLVSPALVISHDNEELFKMSCFADYCKENGLKQGFVDKTSNKITFCFKMQCIKKAVNELLSADDISYWDEKLPMIQDNFNATKSKFYQNVTQHIITEFYPFSTLEDAVQQKICKVISKKPKKVADNTKYLGDDDVLDKEEENSNVDSTFKKNDLVLVHHKEFRDSKKIFPGYHGPYVVRKLLENKKYLITDTLATQLTAKRAYMECPEDSIRKWITKEDLDNYGKLTID